MSHSPVRHLVIGLAVAAATIAAASVAAAQSPAPVLLVIANQDYSHQEYAATRAAIEGRGLQVVVGAASRADAVPQGLRLKRPVRPDVAVREADAADYSAIVFVGGWGASQYQYAFEGTYANAGYRPDPAVADAVNRLIGDFAAQDKPVAGICHGVTVLAWARVDGTSPLSGRMVVGWAGGGPAFERGGTVYPASTTPARAQIEENGATMRLSASVGDPLSSHDDIWVDGRIITAENPAAAQAFGRAVAAAVLAR